MKSKCVEHTVYVDWLLAVPILPTASQHKRMTYTNYAAVPPDDEQ
jgi:hypothetical protein